MGAVVSCFYSPAGKFDVGGSSSKSDIIPNKTPALDSVIIDTAMLALSPRRSFAFSEKSYGTVLSYKIDPKDYLSIFNNFTQNAKIIQTSSDLQTEFTQFIKEGYWIQYLTKVKYLNKSAMTVFEHPEPMDEYGVITFADYTMSPRARRDSYEESNEHFMSRIALIQALKINDSKFSTSASFLFDDIVQTTFSSDQMIPILLASLYPLFEDYRATLQLNLELQQAQQQQLMAAQQKPLLQKPPMQPPHDQQQQQRQQQLNETDPLLRSNSGTTRYNDLTITLPNNTHTQSPQISPTAATTSVTPPEYHVDSIGFEPSAKVDKPVVKRHISGITPLKLAKQRSAKLSKEAVKIKDIYIECADSTSTETMETLLSTGTWIDDFIQSIETLPLSVSIATADTDMFGFPLVYVNREFENITQYNRSEVLGRNCKFLTSHKTERDQSRKLAHCLRHKLACKVAICNVRKDGSEFYNMLAVHPVFDKAGDYRYVIGIQYDITRADATTKEVKLVDDLMIILTNILR